MNDLTRPRPGERPDDDGLHLPMPSPLEVPLQLWAGFIAHTRRRLDMSQTTLAEAAGVTQQTISKVETGDICPHDRLKVRLAAALDLPTAALFPWPPPTEKPGEPVTFAWPTRIEPRASSLPRPCAEQTAR